MRKGFMLSTSDNPWDPSKDFDEWLEWDRSHGYNTLGYQDKMAPTSINFPEELNDKILDEVIGDIVARDVISLMTGGEVHYILVPYTEE